MSNTDIGRIASHLDGPIYSNLHIRLGGVRVEAARLANDTKLVRHLYNR
jgi:hypothetical protein